MEATSASSNDGVIREATAADPEGNSRIEENSERVADEQEGGGSGGNEDPRSSQCRPRLNSREGSSHSASDSTHESSSQCGQERQSVPAADSEERLADDDDSVHEDSKRSRGTGSPGRQEIGHTSLNLETSVPESSNRSESHGHAQEVSAPEEDKRVERQTFDGKTLEEGHDDDLVSERDNVVYAYPVPPRTSMDSNGYITTIGIETSEDNAVPNSSIFLEEPCDDSIGKPKSSSGNWWLDHTTKGLEFLRDKFACKSSGEGGAPKQVSMLGIFKYADWLDVIYMILGVFGAIGDGLAQPASLLLTSGLINNFGTTTNLAAADSARFEEKINTFVLRFVYLALVCGLASFLEALCWMRTGDRQASRLRSMYLKAILRQNEGYFDTAQTKTSDIVNRVSVDTLAIQEAISEKVGNFIANLSTFIGGYAGSFYLEWRVAIVLLGFSPLLVIPGLVYGRILMSLAQKMQFASAAADAVTQEAISSIRTVYSFVGENEALDRYSRALNSNVKLGLKMGLAKGFAVGSYGIIFALWGFVSWYGGSLVIEKGVQGAKVIGAGLAALAGGLALGNALPNLKYFAEGRLAAARVFELLDRVPEIDVDNLGGQVLPSVEGTIELRGVDFAYPSRPDAPIFKNFSLHIPAGMTVALVGSSGSGKSTVVALIERFYDPLCGQVLLDGIDIKQLQLKWMRSQMGLVSQEPALFATSIRENIVYGKEKASEEEVIQAAKAANAHGFISLLPNGYDTQVGERGMQMSGGQKQRIAIARAILKNPPILLLDEATSALDAESESVVQEALESASIGRTTVVVAHRLSTIRRADTIAVLSGGQIVEMGAHAKLLSLEGGAYATLVQLQQAADQRASMRRSSLLERDSLLEGGRMSSANRPRHSSMRISISYLSRAFVDLLGRRSDAQISEADSLMKAEPPSLSRLVALNRPEWRQAVFGCTGAVGYGFVQPLYAYFLGAIVSVMYIADHHKLRRKADRYALTFMGLSIACFLVNFVQHYNFSAMGELLTKRIQTTMLSKIFTFEMGWFDQEENASGAVCSRLASDARVARSLIGDRMSLLVQVSSAIFFTFLLGLLTSWKLALVMIAVQPIVIGCFYARTVLLRSMYNLTMEAQEAGSQVAGEAVLNHRTISAFSSQMRIMDLFQRTMKESQKESRERAVIAGLGLGAAQAAMYMTWALDFWWGGQLIKKGELTFNDLFKCFFILVSSGRMIADAGSMTTDLAKGSSSIVKVFGILDRVTPIDPDEANGIKLEKIEGHVHLRDVDFAYPSRPEAAIFKNFTLRVRAGKNIALVGQSGSGKSTIIGLIERYYDPQRGRVQIDGHDLRTLHLRTFRRKIALVGQEPTLFAGSIRENILYGRENATETELVEACKAANAYQFISALKQGFETQTGERGVQLSGGQKQRIAIARAIIKNPAILLLDEATSALDAQSEKVVQDALNRIMVGRTTIVVAHQLSTIQKCETIAVLQDGRVLEKGSHQQLMAKRDGGAYYSLVQMQNKHDF